MTGIVEPQSESGPLQSPRDATKNHHAKDAAAMNTMQVHDLKRGLDGYLEA